MDSTVLTPDVPILDNHFPDVALSIPIKSVVVWCSRPPRDGTAHWRSTFRLVASDTEGMPMSFSMDMYQPFAIEPKASKVPGGRTSTGDNLVGSLLILSRQDDNISRSPQIAIEKKFRRNCTVGQLLDMVIEQNHYHHYLFNAKGSGCLYWNMRLNDLLAGAGFVENMGEEIATAVTALSSRTIPWPPVEGAFY